MMIVHVRGEGGENIHSPSWSLSLAFHCRCPGPLAAGLFELDNGRARARILVVATDVDESAVSKCCDDPLASSIMPPKFTSRQLAFDAGPVPPFLQKLHAQVGQSRPQLGDKKAATRHNGGDNGGDEFDSLLGHQSHAGPSSPSRREVGSAPQDKTLRGTQGGASDDEDDWAGAQVVVLKVSKPSLSLAAFLATSNTSLSIVH